MKTMLYENRVFWQVTTTSAIRHHKVNRLEILTWHDGEVEYKTRTVKPVIYSQVKKLLQGVTV